MFSLIDLGLFFCFLGKWILQNKYSVLKSIYMQLKKNLTLLVKVLKALCIGSQVMYTLWHILMNCLVFLFPPSHFFLNLSSGKVTVSEPLDHELSPEFFLTVLATDQGSPPLTASTVLSVNVTDVNDNPPRFSQDAYTLHVSEAANIGTEIFKVY